MNSRTRLLSSSLLTGITLLATMAAQPAVAQEAEESAAAPVAVEELVVTGTRLRLPDYTLSAPVVSVTQETLQRSGATNLTDFLREMPALTGSFGSQEGADTGIAGIVGLNLLDLRNLGTQRTLVLVNGRRHVAGQSGTGAVDTNTIPIALVERVEVLTGGASATYGADAVSGVVNFILRDDFEGVDARVQYGDTEHGGAEDRYVSVLLGDNFADDRGNFTFGVEWSKVDELGRDQRDYSRIGQRRTYVQNPDDLDDDPNVPDLVVMSDIRYPDTSPYGSVTTNCITDDPFCISWQGDGQPWVTGRPTGGFFVIGGSGSLTDEFEDELLPALERQVAQGTFRYDLTENIRFFAEAKVARTLTGFTAQPTYDFGYGDFTFWGLFVPLDNPFIPANILADVQQNGTITSDWFGGPPGVLVLRDNMDLGYTGYDIERETYRVVGGFKGALSEHMDYEVSYVYGETNEKNTYLNARITERWLAAIDAVIDPATGQTVCRSTIDPDAIPFDADPRTWGSTFTPGPNSGCVPADIFGRDVSAAAAEWVNTDLERNSEIGQHVLTAFVRGESTPWFELPAGPISYALGVEYRKETYDYEAHDLELQASQQAAQFDNLPYDLTWSGQGSNAKGDYNVKEIYGEVSIPLLRDVPFAQALTVDAAYRYSDYSTAGSTDTWKFGAQWRPVEDIMFRAATARAVRTPNLDDLFAPQQQTFALLDDPCDSDNVGAGTSFRLENCQAALAPFGLDPATFENTNTGSVEGRSGGNPDLQPEKADTVTAGVVLSPRWVPGLQIALDYYEIELKEAIQLFTAQTIVDKCYDLPQPNDFCPLITRSDAAGTGRGFIDFFQRVAVNVASYKTSGWDFSVRYNLDPSRFGVERDIGQFQFSLVGNKLEELTFVELADAEPDVDLGDPDAPEWQVTFDATWRYQNWTVNYGYSWYDKTLAFGVDEPNRFVNDPDYVDNRYYDERSIHDIQVRYDVNERFGVYGGINNFTNQQPQDGFVEVPYVTPHGRFFYVGATMRLDRLGF